jgi:hypothetical protein
MDDNSAHGNFYPGAELEQAFAQRRDLRGFAGRAPRLAPELLHQHVRAGADFVVRLAARCCLTPAFRF